MNRLPTPELDKQFEIINSGKSALIQDFIDWLRHEHIAFGTYDQNDRRGRLFPHSYNEQPEQLMADFFGIDRDKIEAERSALIESIRSDK